MPAIKFMTFILWKTLDDGISNTTRGITWQYCLS